MKAGDSMMTMIWTVRTPGRVDLDDDPSDDPTRPDIAPRFVDDEEEDAPTTLFVGHGRPKIPTLPPVIVSPSPVLLPMRRGTRVDRRIFKVLGVGALLGVVGAGIYVAIALSNVAVEAPRVVPPRAAAGPEDPSPLKAAARPVKPPAGKQINTKTDDAQTDDAKTDDAKTDETEHIVTPQAESEPPLTQRARWRKATRRTRRARRRLARARSGAGLLRIQCSRPFRPVIDGEARPLWRSMRPLALSPGPHRVQIRFADGGAPSEERQITVAEGKTTILFFTPKP
jgi:hypothetical protein